MKSVKYIFVVIFLICTENIFCQVYSLSHLSKWNNSCKRTMSCYLSLLSENQYYILLSVGDDDIFMNLFISYGNFYTKDRSLYLKDIPSGLEIVLEKDIDTNLIVKKGFKFMQNEFFKYVRDPEESSLILNFKEKKKSQYEQELLFRKEKKMNSVPLQLGIYSNNYIALHIGLNFSYQIYCLFEDCSFLLSEGKWLKEGNVLTMKDEILKYHFLALVKDKGLNMIRFPNELNSGWDYFLEKNGVYTFVVQ